MHYIIKTTVKQYTPIDRNGFDLFCEALYISIQFLPTILHAKMYLKFKTKQNLKIHVEELPFINRLVLSVNEFFCANYKYSELYILQYASCNISQ